MANGTIEPKVPRGWYCIQVAGGQLVLGLGVQLSVVGGQLSGWVVGSWGVGVWDGHVIAGLTRDLVVAWRATVGGV
jgi:hypothetical protein